MVVYIAKKPCRFGGQSYLIGDKIPADKIQPRRAGSLVRMGVVEQREEKEASKAPSPEPVMESKVPEKEPKSGKKTDIQK